MAAPKLYATGIQTLANLIGKMFITVDTGGPAFGRVKMKGGTFVCNGATPVTVADTDVDAGSNIVITLNTVGGTVGAIPAVQTITAGTGFTIAGTAGDTSTYNYLILS